MLNELQNPAVAPLGPFRSLIHWRCRASQCWRSFSVNKSELQEAMEQVSYQFYKNLQMLGKVLSQRAAA